MSAYSLTRQNMFVKESGTTPDTLASISPPTPFYTPLPRLRYRRII